MLIAILRNYHKCDTIFSLYSVIKGYKHAEKQIAYYFIGLEMREKGVGNPVSNHLSICKHSPLSITSSHPVRRSSRAGGLFSFLTDENVENLKKGWLARWLRKRSSDVYVYSTRSNQRQLEGSCPKKRERAYSLERVKTLVFSLQQFSPCCAHPLQLVTGLKAPQVGGTEVPKGGL